MPKTFYIIDGHAQIYRAYYAPFRDLTSPTGEPTKATFVFTQMLLNLVTQRKPDYLAMTIDTGDEAVFRKEIYPEYKANRQSPPDDFRPQEQRILQVVKDAGVPVFGVRGFEADDLIATMARRLSKEGYDVFIVSKDKDLRQLVDERTKMYDPQSDEVTDAAAMEAKCGFRPDESVEVQTLVGDPIDNVPGIPGVGEKTAAKLIRKYGTAEKVLEHADELTPKMKENFKTHGATLVLSRSLVTLKDDVEFGFDPETCKFVGFNVPALKKDLESLGFHSLLRRLPETPGAPKPPTYSPFGEGLFGQALPASSGAVAVSTSTADVAAGVPPGFETGATCNYQLIHTAECFAEFLETLKRQKRFAFDTETDSLDPVGANLVGMSFSWEKGTGYYLPVAGPKGATVLPYGPTLEAVKPLLEDPLVRKVGHNIKYDLLVMRGLGVTLRGIELDTMIGAFLLDSGRMQYGIDALARDVLKFQKVPTSDLLGKGKAQVTMDQVDLQKIACYASEDADVCLRLADWLTPKLAELTDIQSLMDKYETPLIDVLAEMEWNGISVDPAVLQEQSGVLGTRADALREKIQKEAGVPFNPDSPKQLGDVLFNQLKLKVIKKTKTGPSTDVEVLEKLADVHPVPKLVLEYRSLVKLKNTYLDNLAEHLSPRDQRIHGSFNQVGAATGRLSMSDPNLQNIPIRTDEGRRIRLAFVPGTPGNVLLTADYSQIELRILAHCTQEPALMRAFEADEDIHRAVAAEVFGVKLEDVSRDQRGQAKTINFGIVYGVSAFGLARRIEGLSVPSAQALIDSYNARFPRIHEFLRECVKHAQDKGYVQTILGRRRPLPDINSGIVQMRNASERMAINSVVQGSAADLIKIAMLNVCNRMRAEKSPAKMLLQVHDELVFESPGTEAPAVATIVREEMIRAGEPMKLTVALKVETGWGKNWQETK